MKIALCVALLTLVSQTIGQRVQRSSNNYTSLRLELGKLGEDKCDALFKSVSIRCSCKYFLLFTLSYGYVFNVQ